MYFFVFIRQAYVQQISRAVLVLEPGLNLGLVDSLDGDAVGKRLDVCLGEVARLVAHRAERVWRMSLPRSL
jgi:hypothetical protein